MASISPHSFWEAELWLVCKTSFTLSDGFSSVTVHPDLNNYPGEHRVITSDRNNGGKTAKIGLNLSQTEMILLYFIFPWSLAHAIYTYTHMANDSLHQ